MFVVLVDFKIKEQFCDQFKEAMCEQARNSLNNEAECHYFDVCQDPEMTSRFFLYELYTDKNAFTAHLNSKHFKEFDQLVKEWTLEKKVQFLQRLP